MGRGSRPARLAARDLNSVRRCTGSRRFPGRLIFRDLNSVLKLRNLLLVVIQPPP